MRVIKKLNESVVTAAVALLLVLGFRGTSLASSGVSNARSVAMAGAYTALARGVEAPNWNPANLGLAPTNRFSINLISLGLGINNNSFSKHDYDLYNGADLTKEDQNRILASIPSDGLKLDLDSELQILGFAYGPVALTASGIVASNLTLAKDFIKLPLLGNTEGYRFTFDDTDGQAQALYNFALSIGFPIKTTPSQKFAIGASLKYLKGFAYAEVTEAEGSLLTSEENAEIEGYGRTVVRFAQGGTGQALDLGAASILNKKWVFSLALMNIASNITWSRKAEQKSFLVYADSINLDVIATTDDKDSLIHTEETSEETGSFTSSLPPVLRIGVARYMKKWVFTTDYVQGFRKGLGTTTTPQLALGTEFRLWKWLPLRIGLSLGGRETISGAVGLGFDLGGLRIDFAATSQGSLLPNHRRGSTMAFGIKLMP